MNANQAKPDSIDAYIAAFPQDVQVILNQSWMTIRAMVPDAQETISYGMPTFTLHGRYLIYVGAYKKHIGLYPAPTGVEEFDEAVALYGGGKGTLKFPLDKPMPFDLIRRVVRFREKEQAEKTKK
jgi:uncharacterized protein YdhG (YjbR/CyaY superfamily)